MNENKKPSPDEMLAKAQEAAGIPTLKDYISTIMTLRECGWSDRKIADWFCKQGYQVTFGQIYYVRSRHIDEETARELDESVYDRPVSAEEHNFNLAMRNRAEREREMDARVEALEREERGEPLPPTEE
ncbi:MAG: hypothetical protein WC360_06980 [Opitutales bacterium]